MEDNKEQPEKARCPMLVTLLGIVIEVSPLQPKNALSPILVTLLGIAMVDNEEQPQKAAVPIVVTLLGMIVDLQLAIRVLVVVSIIALQLSRLS